MAKTLRRPAQHFEGISDPYIAGAVLVPVTDRIAGLNKLNYTVPLTSYWRMKGGQPVAIVTVAPGDVHIGWDTCGHCACPVSMCNCGGGVVAPHSVTHIYVQRGGTKPTPPEPTLNGHRTVKTLKFRSPKKTLRRPDDERVAEAMLSNVVKSLKRPGKSLKR